MPKPIFNAIEAGNLAALEQILEAGTSPITENEAGLHPLTLVGSLIESAFEAGAFEQEDTYKRMAAMLIVHGAPDGDLEHALGEVSNLRRYTCRYIIELSMKRNTPERVAELIAEKYLWFENDDPKTETAFMNAVKNGDRSLVDAMFEAGRVNYAFEQ
ncbi:hypothetical protein LOH54_04650 [Sulfurimonas sp. HSL-3221]|uniref:hypothetical protein n=1 Tax=Sulfurimonadaceae TaxID=2771471 RepID=UPI001E3FC54F|nr:hypothetical protein [Sulfurimonas sp. HSL-3221]UFS63422.1 hypothetical protein LOH54_04650 [Sulfurimonas sp. HSL-3221]